MGKVIKAVAIIAVAAGIAAVAPWLAGFVATAGTAGFTAAAAAITVGLSLAATAAYGAFGFAPGYAATGRRPLSIKARSPDGLAWIDEPMKLSADVIPPMKPQRWWWAYFFPGTTWTIQRTVGDCMMGHPVAINRWIVVDRYADISPGDIFVFQVDDLWKHYKPVTKFALFWRLVGVDMGKRYLGIDHERQTLVFDLTNPPTICETGLRRIRYAYRVDSWHSSPIGAWKRGRQLSREARDRD